MVKESLVSFAKNKCPEVKDKIRRVDVEARENSVWDTSNMNSKYVMDVVYKDETRIGDRAREIVEVDDPKLRDRIDDVIERTNRRISVRKPGVIVEDPIIRYRTSARKEKSPEWVDEKYEIDSDFSSFRTVSIERDRVSEEFRNIVDLVCNHAEERFNDEITIDSFRKLELRFADFSVCELTGVRADILTDNPHRYYEGVESVEEYVERSDVSTSPPYEVFFRLDMVEGNINKKYIPEDIKSEAESIMDSRMSEWINTSGVSTYEAESIVFDGSERTTFFVRQDLK